MASDLAAAGRLIERVARSGASSCPYRSPPASRHPGDIPERNPWPGWSNRRAGVTHAVRDLFARRPARQELSRLSGNTAAHRRS